MSTTNLKPQIFLIEKNYLLTKKRNLSINSNTNVAPIIPVKKKCGKGDLIQNNNDKIDSNNSCGEIRNNSIPIFKKGKWSEDEDNLLIKYINKFGVGKWNKIERFFVGRTRKQIRQRYISNIKIKKISDEITQNISCNSYSSSSDEEENKDNLIAGEKIIFKWDDYLDRVLLKEYFLNKKSWVKISKKIPGSSENSVKNRFYSLLRQKLNKTKKEYKYKYMNKSMPKKSENNDNNLILLIKKEIYGNKKSLDNNDIEDPKQMIFNNIFFENDNSDNKSKRRNYSVEILLEFLPELLEDKGINICEILNELQQRKSTAAKQIFIVIERHFDCRKDSENNDDYNSISTDIEFDSLQNMQSEKLGMVIKNMKLKIMYKYFHRFRYNTLGI